jgi:hypothetical protein
LSFNDRRAKVAPWAELANNPEFPVVLVGRWDYALGFRSEAADIQEERDD